METSDRVRIEQEIREWSESGMSRNYIQRWVYSTA
jgi:hypothetical protein